MFFQLAAAPFPIFKPNAGEEIGNNAESKSCDLHRQIRVVSHDKILPNLIGFVAVSVAEDCITLFARLCADKKWWGLLSRKKLRFNLC